MCDAKDQKAEAPKKFVKSPYNSLQHNDPMNWLNFSLSLLQSS